MAKHKGSGCEGQACLRREEEGSASLMDKFFGLAAGAVGIGIPAGIVIDCYSRFLDDVEFLREEEPMIEEHVHRESVPYLHAGDSESRYSAGGSTGSGSAGVGNDELIIIQGRVRIAIGEFRSKDLEDYPTVGDLTERKIQKSMIEHLNEFEGVTAESLDDILYREGYTKEELEKDPEMLYRIPGVNAVLEGSYEIGDPEDDLDDGDMGITISSTHVYWGNGKFFDVRRYSVPGFVSELETLCVCLANRVVGEKSPSTTFHKGSKNPCGGFLFSLPSGSLFLSDAVCA